VAEVAEDLRVGEHELHSRDHDRHEVVVERGLQVPEGGRVKKERLSQSLTGSRTPSTWDSGGARSSG
jgi:hypothetical protein